MSTPVAAASAESAVAGIPIAEAIVDACGPLSATAAVAAPSVMWELGKLASDPLAGLSSAGIGWLIEHVAFLREPFDVLAGDPDAITQLNVQLGAVKEQISVAQKEISSLDAEQWSGHAADGYRRSASDVAATLAALEECARVLATVAISMGAVVGALRSWVRDEVADFVAKAIIEWAAASATSVPTMGGSLEAFIADEVAYASVTGAKIAKKMTTELRQLADCMSAMKPLSNELSRLRDAPTVMGALARGDDVLTLPLGAGTAAAEATDEAERQGLR